MSWTRTVAAWALLVVAGGCWAIAAEHGALLPLAWMALLAPTLLIDPLPSLRTITAAGAVTVVSAGTTAAALAASTGASPDQLTDRVLLAMVNTLWALAVVVAVVALGRYLWQRGEHRRRGWRLADALAAEREATLRAALMQERASMAGEIHDGIGHRLAYITLAVGRLSTEPGLDPRARSAVEQVREDLADVTDELGSTLYLLRGGRAPATVAGRDLRTIAADLVERGANLDLRGEDAADRASTHAVAALGRVLEEAAANAARHADGGPVNGRLTRVDDTLQLTCTTQLPSAGDARSVRRPRGDGTGLATLARRLEVIGGHLDHSPTDGSAHGDFVVRAVVDHDARPRPQDGTEALNVSAERERSRHRVRRGVGRATAATVGLALAGAAASLAVIALRTELGVLPPRAYDALVVGQSREQTDRTLPAVQMLEPPPVDALVTPAQPGWECSFYEASASWFERSDVHAICLDTDTLVHKERIPAP